MSNTSTFKSQQLEFLRVEEAYKVQGENVFSYLKSCDIDNDNFQIYLRAFKDEEELELWAKDKDNQEYKLLKTYDICGSSGSLGPKRMQGDYQVPEGYYHIDRFNPKSKFHLSLGINYPNFSDKILSNSSKPGGDIFIHGGCQTIGCIPISNEWIEELYVYCVEATNTGQNSIPITIFPFKMDNGQKKVYKEGYPELANHSSLWDDLEKGYAFFNKYHKLPTVKFMPDGSHEILK